MAKKKKAKTKTRGTPQRQIKIVVPGGLHAVDKKVLQGIADLLTAAGAAPDTGKITIVDANDLDQPTQNNLSTNEVTAKTTCP
jgi:hypothetical protein